MKILVSVVRFRPGPPKNSEKRQLAKAGVFVFTIAILSFAIWRPAGCYSPFFPPETGGAPFFLDPSHCIEASTKPILRRRI
ncbi:MAG TPA: hypothetical protein VJ577_08740 [Burkholderiaceae bacterium]|nr:hypothetical protein [Burkholderiaceae bacterium]